MEFVGKDVQACALFKLSIRLDIIPYIRSCKTTKEVWDTLATVYTMCNEANASYLYKQLESNHISEEDYVDSFLTKIKDFQEQSIVVNYISNSSLMQIVLDGLHDSYQSFASTLSLIMKGNSNVLKFEELFSMILQEEKSRQNKSMYLCGRLSFIASQRAKSEPSFNKPKVDSYSMKDHDKESEKPKKQKAWSSPQCMSKIEGEVGKKETVSFDCACRATSHANSTSYVQDTKWAFDVTSCHNVYMLAIDSHVQYFDRGANKHKHDSRTILQLLQMETL